MRNPRVNGDRSTAPTLAHTHTHTTQNPAKKGKKTFCELKEKKEKREKHMKYV